MSCVPVPTSGRWRVSSLSSWPVPTLPSCQALVGMTARSETGLAVDHRSAVSNKGGPLSPCLDSLATTAGPTVIIIIDLGNDVVERGEGNNRIWVTVALPSRNGRPCRCSVPQDVHELKGNGLSLLLLGHRRFMGRARYLG
jgi:hypothetical protein